MATSTRSTLPHRLLVLLIVTAAVLAATPAEVFAQDRRASQQEKDDWDKIEAVSGLLSGVLVAVIGGFATYVYNQRQRSAQAAERARELGTMEAQTVASFLPHLHSGHPQEKEAALVAMSALGNTALVARLAAIYRDEGSVGALSRIASGTDPQAAGLAEASLEQILTSAVVQIQAAGTVTTGFAVAPGFVVTADYLGEALGGRASVVTVDGESHEATMVGREPEHGLMVLRVEAAALGTLRLLEEGVPPDELGELTQLGWGSSGWRYSLGRLEGSTAGHEIQPALSFLRARIETEPGQGGAPVVDRVGRVVAMHYAKDFDAEGEPVALLVPADTIRAGLIAFGVPLAA